MNLRAISPIDGRYADKMSPLQPYLSEWALFKHRLLVEVRWLLAMSQCANITHVRPFTTAEQELLRSLVTNFDDEAARRIKAIEARTKHDVKAVEYYIREAMTDNSLCDMVGAVHFACTSDDINNLAYGMMFRDAMSTVWQPEARELLEQLDTLAHSLAAVPMLARTHGQAATPTTVGKEIFVFAHRLRRQLKLIEAQEYLGKFNGAVGAYNAHRFAYPEVDWQAISRQFVSQLGLTHNPLTTQIEPHDFLAELAHSLARFNTVLLDFCRDMWSYISLGYFRQQTIKSEVGSSTMPHKINPIDFENAEANLGISNATLLHLAGKLPVSRLQRDLSDSSALRNYGMGIAHSYLALLSLRGGLKKIEIDRQMLEKDLDPAWEVLAEALQTVLRLHHIPDAYEQLKELTRGERVSKNRLHDFIRSLDIPQDEKQRLLELSPSSYIGDAADLVLRERDQS